MCPLQASRPGTPSLPSVELNSSTDFSPAAALAMLAGGSAIVPSEVNVLDGLKVTPRGSSQFKVGTQMGGLNGTFNTGDRYQHMSYFACMRGSAGVAHFSMSVLVGIEFPGSSV